MSLTEVSDPLLDIMERYNWQIVSRQYIEVVPNERKNAWKDLFIMMLSKTPQAYRKNLRRANLENFDYKQPIFYDLKRKQLGLATRDILQSLDPPSDAVFDSSLISPAVVVSGFIMILLSYIIVEGMY
uniref:Per os infectivity factor-6 n=1 Tax=Cryptophlebia leucotreta granulosis virus TaxID=35254 RepID=A0A2H4ZKG0_GVCL|nr:per os infectivity factor-6 [Cryptophlebia leucotreta granulovirus]